MLIRATADLHGHLPDIEPCDILIIAGDVLPDFIAGETEHQYAWALNVLAPWLESIPAKYIVAIAGNHDFAFQNLDFLGPSLPWIYLQDSGTELEGLKIYGSPWVPNLEGWAFYAPTEALRAAWSLIPQGLDILITHGPPYGKGDKTVPMYGSLHAGCPYLLAELEKKWPKLHIFGHIHEGFGAYVKGEIDLYNVAYCDAGFPYPVRGVIVELEYEKKMQAAH